MSYLITHSLLSAWLYSMRDNPYADATSETSSKEDFLRVLRREPTPTTEAMQNGIDFENLVTDIVHGVEIDPGTKWLDAAKRVAEIVKGAQLQYGASVKMRVHNLDLVLYGRLDALKAGHIQDIKFSRSYERGKYFDSTQHPMYLEIIPEADDFTYVVSDGTEVWTETYRREETQSIVPIINEFLSWLDMTGYMEMYQHYWPARD